MTEHIKKTSDPTREAESDMVSISVPGHLAEAVSQFVRQLESEDADTRAHMLSLLTTRTSTNLTEKGTDLPVEEL